METLCRLILRLRSNTLFTGAAINVVRCIVGFAENIKYEIENLRCKTKTGLLYFTF